MASGLFGSGPQSNILNTVAGSYESMLSAEKQKGASMREAMGAFGKAIDPKTIGMNKFKKQFADADWTNPETYFQASQFLTEFDPAAAMSMSQKGIDLAKTLVPKQVAPSSISKQVTEAWGLAAGTPEHRAKMQTLVGNKNKIQNILSPFEQTRELSKNIQNDPSYKFAQNRLIKIRDAQNLIPEVRAGNETAATLLERTLSESYNADTRAASEIDRLTQSRSWGRGMRDWMANKFTGTPSGITMEEYEAMLSIADIAMRSTINKVVDINVSLYGDLMGAEQVANVASTLRIGEPKSATQTPTDEPEIMLTQKQAKAAGAIMQAPEGTPDGQRMIKGKAVLVKGGWVYDIN